ncbi:MAG: hypothetical protein IBX52_03445 [Bacterioplanes sp.]|nr:hypothetical protein [Bacterioplanes sp.]
MIGHNGSTLVANAGFNLPNVVIGNLGQRINLESTFGSIDGSAGTTVYGNITSASGQLTLNSTTVNGDVVTNSTVASSSGLIVNGNVSARNGVTLNGAVITGSLSATNGTINLTGGQVGGLVVSSCCDVTTNGTDLLGGAQSTNSSLSISGGTIAGDFSSPNNPAVFNGVIMTSGTVNAGSVAFTGGTLGSSSSPISVTSQFNAITLNNTGLAYGDFVAPSYSAVELNGNSVVIGSCSPNACVPPPVCDITSFSDNFNRNNLGSNWVAGRFAGNFTPTTNNGRLLLTENQNQQSTAVTLQRWFPAANNRIQIEFDHFAWRSYRLFGGNEGGDGMAVVFSDASITPQAGSFGGSLGYAQRDNGDPGFAGGWLGIALDEFGNFSNPTEGRIGGPGRRSDSVTIRGSGNGNAGYFFLANTRFSNSLDVDPSFFNQNPNPGPGFRYRFTIDATVDNQVMVSVARRTTSSGAFVSVIEPFNVVNLLGQAAIPQNLMLSFTGATGDAVNNHAIDNLQVCANEINDIGTLVDHFRLSFSSSALTCSAKEVTVVACANPNCTQQVTEPVSVTMSINGQAVGSPQVITGGSGTVQVRNTSEDTVSVGIAGSTPAQRPFSQNLCSRDGGALGTNCNITFADSGFALSVPDFPANRGETLEVRAIKKDDATQACVPGFSNTNKTLEFWGTYVNPGSSGRVANWPLSIQGNDIGMSEASASAQTVAFDANGVASVPINYADVGRMQVNARLQPSGDDAGLSMTGNTQFVSYPAGFCVQASTACSAPYDACPALAKASENIPLSVQAMAWQVDGDTDFCSGNSPTPSFAMNTMALSSELIAPATGVNATVSPASLTYSASTSANTVPVSFSEVGVFAVRVTPSAPYLGITLDSAVSHAMGRITPDHFTANLANSPELAPYCQTSSAFAYSGQSLNWLVPPRVDLIARNGVGQVTQNYTQGNFLRLNSAGVGVQWPSQDNVALATDSSPLALNSTAGAAGLNALGNGQLRYDFSALDQLTYVKTPTSRVDPFAPDVTFGLTVNDSDGVGLLSSPFTFSPAANFALRYGRLWVDNGFGPENQDLPLSLRTEFYQSGRFIRNTDDSCWSYDAVGNVSLTPTTLTEVNGTTGTLINGDGVGAIVLRAPTAVPGLPDVGQVEVEYAVPVWLRDDFNNDGTLTSPRAQAQFGVYRGHDRIIYWRERQ